MHERTNREAMRVTVRDILRIPMRALLLAAALTAVGAGATAAVAQAEPRYRDPGAPVAARVADLLDRMTLEEKVGQMAMVDLARLMGEGPWDRGPLNDAWLERTLGEAQVGSLLSGGNAAPVPDDPEGWASTIHELQRRALDTSRLGIPILYGVDAVHGHAAVRGATVLPHQLGLAATFDEELVTAVARATAEDVAASGASWNFAPVADLGRDPRWGRTYETFGEAPALAAALTAAHVRGQAQVAGVASTAKHFVGYGQAESGDDRAPADLSARALREIHLPPFAEAVRAGVPTMMVGSGSVAGVPVHASRALLTDLLRAELGFDGVVVSDWADVEKLASVHRVAGDPGSAVALAVNAGVDVIMIPHDAEGTVAALREQVALGAIDEARIDEAVGRVLALKIRLGLFEAPYPDPARAERVHDGHDELARRAALAGTTLLLHRNDALPLNAAGRVLVTGPGASDVAMQSGGWTLGWQGADPFAGTPRGTSVADGLIAGASSAGHVAMTEGDAADLIERARASDAVVLVLGEPPYAEGAGDSDALALPPAQAALADRLVQGLDGADTSLVVVLLAGRPLVLPASLTRGADAIVMAYLPGSQAGPALADLLYGRVAPSGRLPVTWPASVGQLPIHDDEHPSETDRAPAWPLGHGLSYARFAYRDATVTTRLDASRERELVARVDVHNVGEMAADHVVLVHASFPVLPTTTPERLLVGFSRVRNLEPGASATALIRIPERRLARVAGDVLATGPAEVAPGRYRFAIGDLRVDHTLAPW